MIEEGAPALVEQPVVAARRNPVLVAAHWLDLVAPFVVAILVGALVLGLTGQSVVGTYRLLWEQSVGGQAQIANTLAAATPILFTGLATAVAFRAGVFNVGVEGSLYLGAFVAAWVGFTFVHLPGFVLVVLAAAGAVVAGLTWALIPGAARAWWGVNEVVTTLMLNYVAILLTGYLVNYHFLASGVANSMSPLVAPGAQLTPLIAGSQLTIAFPIALALAALYAYFFRFTTLGYQLRLTGISPRFARASGISLARAVMVAMILSGAIGGLGGAFHLLGVNYRFVDNFSPGYGFTGIAVALLGRNHPVGIVLAAIFFGALSNGGAMIQLFSSIPLDLVNILQGTIMIFAVIDLVQLPAFQRALSRA